MVRRPPHHHRRLCDLALYTVLKHFASGKRGNTLCRDFDLFTGFRVQALTSRTLAWFKGTETKDSNFFSFDNGINDGVDSGVNDERDVRFGEFGASSNEVDEVSFVHGRSGVERERAG